MISNSPVAYVHKRRPPVLNPDGVPQILKEQQQWICWSYFVRHAKSTKCPVCPRTGRIVNTTDSKVWCSFEEAIAACQERGSAGVGFVFSDTDPFTGIDLDDCLDVAGRPVPTARAIIDQFNSYAEVSPSGRGVKIFIEALKPGPRCRSTAIEGFTETEIYSTRRFFAVTGSLMSGCPVTIEPRQAELDALYNRLWPESASTSSVAGLKSAGNRKRATVARERRYGYAERG